MRFAINRVVPGLGPGIHEDKCASACQLVVDGRDKHGHDDVITPPLRASRRG
jgi:hypothetical protein